ncbi:HVO_2072 family ArtA-dependent S-layer glycoprotein [Haloplanus aerogenes]|uniref:Major cell surface glycoprotein n=1 Tax=Haloplanus aerogenes TaxID=660522 RepID=A0A3M0DTH1_9EURY|nr:HVO_2072 family ArtA-dependent S-layer glycoprotein [Haloplanus aerogenes]AZH24355.1 major cell surface glycoprotein [Haloplanus aerogenes]RMB24010.1 major cell surface glycoprotein (TIGR04216 family) [Haloplanus aerogenes]
MNVGTISVVVVTVFVVSSAAGVGVVVGGTDATADVSGAAAQFAQDGDVSALAPRGRWNPATSRGELVLDGESYYRVYRGEADIDRWRRASDDADVTGRTLSGQGGAADGDVLDLSASIPRDQTVGRYADGDLTAQVVEPRITSLRLVDSRGVELGSDVTVRRSQRLLLRVDWNFVEAEDLQVDVRRDGVGYENEALSTAATSEQLATLPSGFDRADLAREMQGAGTTGRSTAAWLFDFTDLDPGVYTLRVEGVDDLTTGDATRTVTVRAGTESRPTLGFDDRTVSRGDWARFTITGSDSGTYHAVSIPRSRLRSSTTDPARVFRAVGDVAATGSTDQRAYGIVEIPDSGEGVGSVDTGLLDTGRTTVTLHGARSTRADAVSSVTDQPGGVSTVALDVDRAGLSTNLGDLTYTTGTAVDVRGTGSGADRVALYIRDGGDWYLLTLDGRRTVRVGADGVWEVRNVVLSDGGDGGYILRVPGTYRLGVVDADQFDDPTDPPDRIFREEFADLRSEQKNIRTVAPGLTGRVTTYDGEVADTDAVAVRGVAAGAVEVGLVVVDQRGGIRAASIRVDRDTTFEASVRLADLARGRVTALIVAPGRDGEFGSGSVRTPDGTTIRLDSVGAFLRYVETQRDRGHTGEQTLARIEGEVLTAAGSDDLAVRQTLQLAAPRTTVRDVVPADRPDATGMLAVPPGGTMLVRGTTNRNPDDALVVVEVIEGPSAASFPSVTTAAWGSDGIWSAQLAVPAGADPGTYTLRIEDGETAVTRQVVIGRERTPTERPPPPTERPTVTAMPTEHPSTPTDRPTATPTPTAPPSPTNGGGPGFGPLVATLALCAFVVVTLTRRRR